MIPKINHIRYANLDSLLDATKKLTRDSRVNFFINLEPIFRKMLNKKFNQYLQVMTEERVLEMVSDIVNIAAHYRAFFINNGIYCKVILYFSDMDSKQYLNKDFIEDYRDHFNERFHRTESRPLYRVLKEALPLAATILQYFEGVYLLSTYDLEASTYPLLFTQEYGEDDDVNMLLTNDPYEYQYANEGFIILRANMDNSVALTDETIIDRLKFENKLLTDETINPKYISFILSFVNDKYRNIEGIRGVGIGKAIKLFRQAINAKLIAEAGSTIGLVTEILEPQWQELIRNNHAVIDLKKQSTRFDVLHKSNLEKQIIDKFDNMSLKQLNQNFFTNHPLMLLELQTKDRDKKKKRSIFDNLGGN